MFVRRSLRRARTLDWTMPTCAWGVTLDVPFASWVSGGMSYGAYEQVARCQGKQRKQQRHRSTCPLVISMGCTGNCKRDTPRDGSLMANATAGGADAELLHYNSAFNIK
jgi:hypothetical protein